MQLCLDWNYHAVRIAARRFVATLALIKLSLPGSRVGLERIVPPSLSCLLPVALGRDDIRFGDPPLFMARVCLAECKHCMQ